MPILSLLSTPPPFSSFPFAPSPPLFSFLFSLFLSPFFSCRYGRGDGRGDLYAIYSKDDATFDVIKTHATKVQALREGSRPREEAIPDPFSPHGPPKGEGEDGVGGFEGLYGLYSSEGVVTTLAGQANVTGHADGSGSGSGSGSALFNSPHGLAVSSDGRSLYVADTNNHCIRRVDTATGATATVAGVPGEAGEEDGAVGEARFSGPVAVAVAGDGTFLLVADAGNNNVRKVSLPSGTTTTHVAKETDYGWIGNPQGIACAGAQCERALLVDSGNSRILDISDGTVRVAAGPTDKGWEKKGFEDGPGENATFSFPLSGVLSEDGTTGYVSSNDNCAVRQIDMESGDVVTLAGDGEPGSRDSHNVFGEPPRFRWPMGLALSPDGRYLFVADQYNNRIRAIDVRTRDVTTVAGWIKGHQDGHVIAKDTEDPDTFVAAMFDTPRGVAAARVANPADEDGATLVLYVADSGNHLIRKVAIRERERPVPQVRSAP